MMDITPIDAARDLLSGTLVWDNHACMPLRPADHSFLPQLGRLRESNIDVVTLNIGMDINSPMSHLEMLESFHRWIDQHSDHYVVVGDLHDIARARQQGRLAIAFDLEGMGLFDDGDLSRLQQFRDGGALWMLVAYNRNNRAGGGCLDEDPGLSAHGRAILEEMRRVGMIACCSHSGHRTAMDVIAAADNPVIFSHSNAAAVHAHPRNIPDPLIKACAETGGVVGINGVGDFLGSGEDYAELLCRHIDHMVTLVGPDHVGLSLDYVFDKQEVFDYIEKMRESFGEEMASQFTGRFAPPEVFIPVTARLLTMGYTPTSIQKIVGGNWARVAEEVWRKSPST